MTQEGWREAVLAAVRRHDAGDSTLLELMAKLLTEQDAAKNRLQDIGYGCTGMSWAKVVEEIGEQCSR